MARSVERGRRYKRRRGRASCGAAAVSGGDRTNFGSARVSFRSTSVSPEPCGTTAGHHYQRQAIAWLNSYRTNSLALRRCTAKVCFRSLSPRSNCSISPPNAHRPAARVFCIAKPVSDASRRAADAEFLTCATSTGKFLALRPGTQAKCVERINARRHARFGVSPASVSKLCSARRSNRCRSTTSTAASGHSDTHADCYVLVEAALHSALHIHRHEKLRIKVTESHVEIHHPRMTQTSSQRDEFGPPQVVTYPRGRWIVAYGTGTEFFAVITNT